MEQRGVDGLMMREESHKSKDGGRPPRGRFVCVCVREFVCVRERAVCDERQRAWAHVAL